jgi:quercetin dioxygenase-like cupin family protein
MHHNKFSETEPREIFPGFVGRFYHSAHSTFVHWEISPNAPLPEHSHVHEQVVNVIEGQFELTVEGKTTILNSGDVVVIPSNARHTGHALTKCKVIDVFYPIREDYR